jgi:hypothetical protein
MKPLILLFAQSHFYRRNVIYSTPTLGIDYLQLWQYRLPARIYLACRQRKLRNPKLEKIILNSNNSGVMVEYAKHIIRGRWVEAEQYIMNHSFYWDIYRRYLGWI